MIDDDNILIVDFSVKVYWIVVLCVFVKGWSSGEEVLWVFAFSFGGVVMGRKVDDVYFDVLKFFCLVCDSVYVVVFGVYCFLCCEEWLNVFV